jgi:Icc-related predicted phosphoesterase
LKKVLFILFIAISGLNFSGTPPNKKIPVKKSVSAPLSRPALIRGPYLQLGTPTSIIIRWATDKKTNARVQYGLTSDKLEMNVNRDEAQNEHEIQLKDLAPDTKYYYIVGSSTDEIKNSSIQFFHTAPLEDAGKKVRIWVTGDCGSGAPNQLKVRDQYIKYIGEKYTNMWLLLGDNAYEEGFQDEYQANFFNIYRNHTLKETVLWPVPGNHDYANNKERQVDHNIAYFDIFTLPTNGEAGGVPSHNKAYYSFNYENIHFIALDSYGKEPENQHLYDTLSPQAIWLKKDLAANKKLWTIAFWHHPPYSKASHYSDKDHEMKSIRKNLLPILDRYKVDLVLCGHSHGYERSRPMKGYYGKEDSFDAALYNTSNSSGRYDSTLNSCPYINNVDTGGTVYVVAGSSGRLEGVIEGFPHKAMFYSNIKEGGSLAIDVKNNTLIVKWISSEGFIRDQFTMMKNVKKTTNYSILSGQKCTLTASWEGAYSWADSKETAKSIVVTPTSTSTFTVKDNLGCLKDIFVVEVKP